MTEVTPDDVKVALRALMDVVWRPHSLATLELTVRKLPPEMVALLARGPLPEPSCRLCQTLNSRPDEWWEQPENEEARNAAVVLLDYHELSSERAALVFSERWQMDGTSFGIAAHFLSCAVYHRCQLVYSAAQKVVLSP
jgi:hypothetical protein